MKSKAVLPSLIISILVLIATITACNRTSMLNDGIRVVPHDTNFGFENCLVCHTGSDIAIDLKLVYHQVNPTNGDCLIPGCHEVGLTVIGDGEYLTPHDLDGIYEDCMLCHYHYGGSDNPLAFSDDLFHQPSMIPNNESCITAACHPPSGITPTPTPTTTPTTTTTTTTTTEPTPTTTTTEPTTTTTTTTTEPTITTTTTTTEPTEPPVISAEWHPGVKDVTLCFICHVGVEGQVVDPWPTSHVEEGRTNDSCLNEGCHVFEQQ